MNVLDTTIKAELGLENEPINIYTVSNAQMKGAWGSFSPIYDVYGENEFIEYAVCINASVSDEYYANVLAHELRHVWQFVNGTYRIELGVRWSEQANEIDAREYASKWGNEPDVVVR